MTSRRLLLLVAFMILQCGFCQGANPDQSMLRIQSSQQKYVTEYVKSYPFPSRFSSVTDIDQYFRKLTDAWTKHANADSLPDVSLSPYVYIWTLKNYGDTGAPPWQEQRIYTQFMVPAFLHNLKWFEASQVRDNAFAIRISDIVYLCSDLSLSATVSIEQWVLFTKAIGRMPLLLDSYANQWSKSDTLMVEELRKMRERINRFLPLFDIKKTIYDSNRDSALSLLRNALNQEYFARELIPLANALWRSYAVAKIPQGAATVLDLVARTFTVVDLSDDFLRRCYREIDPQSGESRFDRIVKNTRPNVLTLSPVHLALTGIYYDLTSGHAIELDTLRGKLILLDFWATWCGPCIEEIPRLNKFIATYGNKITLVSVCSDAITKTADITSAQHIAKEKGITYIALYDLPDRSLTERLNVGKLGWPRKFLIDESGHLIVHPRDPSQFVELEEVQVFLSNRKQIK